MSTGDEGVGVELPDSGSSPSVIADDHPQGLLGLTRDQCSCMAKILQYVHRIVVRIRLCVVQRLRFDSTAETLLRMRDTAKIMARWTKFPTRKCSGRLHTTSFMLITC